MTGDALVTELDGSTPLRDEVVSAYRERGYVRMSNVFTPDILERTGQAITSAVLTQRAPLPPMAKRSTYDRAFIQVTNLWQRDETARQFVMGRRLARIAAELMGVHGVRLYHDQALYKEPSGGHTPWHVDQYYWPLASDHCCTAWVPLQHTPLEMGPLAFAVGSHRLVIGRDMAIGDESERLLRTALEERGVTVDERPYALGDVSFHSGWTAHRAGPNTTPLPRAVMTVIYIDCDMRLAEPRNANQVADREVFCPDVGVGEVIDSPLNPILYRESR